MRGRIRPARRLRTAFGTALLGIALTIPAAAADRDNILAMRLADLESQGKCEEAVSVYAGSGSANPQHALIAGRCQVRSSDYAGAVETLAAVRDDPNAPADVDLQLGVAEYHLGELDASRASLERARARGSEGAMVELYTGLLQLQADEARGAALSLERARRLDAGAVEPVASYYAFLAWRSVEEEERAEAALERLRESDPDGPWIAEAERILDGGTTADETPNFWANAEAGLEYDTNVIVKGDVREVFINGEEVDDEEDWRGVWSVDAGSELFRTDRWSGGIMGSYTGTAHFTIDEFDTHYPVGSAWLDFFAAERTTLRARYDYGFAWVGYDPYLSGHTVTGTMYHVWGAAGMTELSAIAGFNDFRYDLEDPDGPGVRRTHDIDRDGTELSGEIIHYYPTGLEDLGVRGGYRYSWYESDGREFDYMAHRFFAGFDVTLPFEIGWDSLVAFTYRTFEDPSVYASSAFQPDHRDRQWELATELEKHITENLSLIARYSFTDSGSNTNAYDYDRHIVGGYIRYQFR